MKKAELDGLVKSTPNYLINGNLSNHISKYIIEETSIEKESF